MLSPASITFRSITIMTTPSEVDHGDASGTDLIRSLAGEFFRGSPSTRFPSPSPAAAPSSFPSSFGEESHLSSLEPVHRGTTTESSTVEPGSREGSSEREAKRADAREDYYESGNPHLLIGGNGNGRAQIRTLDEIKPATPHDDGGFYFLPKSGGKSLADHRTTFPHGHAPSLDVPSVRRDFPALHQRVNGKPLIWLDNAATTHKPQSVIEATSSFYSRDNSNIHRAAHTLAARSTDLFEAGRDKVARFLGAASPKEIVFVRGTTEAINLVAQSYGRKNIGPGDEILLTTMEHHANIVPWQLLAEQVGAVIRVAPINDKGELILEQFASLLSGRTRIVAITHVSNALGTINPVEQVIALSHAYGIPVLVDGAQSTPHLPVNVTALDADFYTLSGHKIFGPTGIGVLYAKAHLLEAMPPWQGGGHMIKDVTFAKTQFNHAPEKFEAGTPDIAGVVGLGAAVDYLMNLGMPAIAAYEHALGEYATEALSEIPGIRPIGTAHHKASVLSFVIPGVPNEKIARYLDQHGIAVRAGHHCAQPAQRRFGVEGTVRPSLAFYNTREEVDTLVRVLKQLPRT